MASSSPSPSNADPTPPDSESQLSSLIYDFSNQIQGAMENMLKMTNEIDQNSTEISEEIEKCKGFVLERRKALEAEKEIVQTVAYSVIDMLGK